MKKAIVCFGDSLTWGWWKRGYGHDPYCNVLNDELKTSFHDGITAVQFGIAGETTSQMVQRLPNVLMEVRGEKKKVFHPDMQDCSVHSIVILGGANDLANPSVSAADIMTNLTRLTEIALQATSKVALCTLLPFNIEGEEAAVPRAVHAQLNEAIRNFCCQKDAMVVCIDLERGIPPRAQEPGIWNDAVHLNDKGYSMMGAYIWEEGSSSMIFSEAVSL